VAGDLARSSFNFMDVLLEGVSDLLLAFTLIVMQVFVATPVLAGVLQVVEVLFHNFWFDILRDWPITSFCGLGLHGVASICGGLIDV
jgi:hypothetical protein